VPSARPCARCARASEWAASRCRGRTGQGVGNHERYERREREAAAWWLEPRILQEETEGAEVKQRGIGALRAFRRDELGMRERLGTAEWLEGAAVSQPPDRGAWGRASTGPRPSGNDERHETPAGGVAPGPSEFAGGNGGRAADSLAHDGAGRGGVRDAGVPPAWRRPVRERRPRAGRRDPS